LKTVLIVKFKDEMSLPPNIKQHLSEELINTDIFLVNDEIKNLNLLIKT
jgi:hypothetical protein